MKDVLTATWEFWCDLPTFVKVCFVLAVVGNTMVLLARLHGAKV